MSSTTTERTIDVFRDVFAPFGIPEVLVSNNGPQFVSEEMARFLLSMGVEHMYSAPYHPQSNGEAERSVQTFKSAMKSMKGGEGTLSQKLPTFLLQYRNTPNVTTGITPSEHVMNLLSLSVCGLDFQSFLF